MKLPDSLLESHFEARFKRGVIIRYLMPDPDDPSIENRYKFALLVNIDASDEDSILLLTTSRLDKAKPFRQRFPDGYHEFGVGSYPWVSQTTLLNLRQTKCYKRAFLIEALRSGQFTFESDLDEVDLAAIDKKLQTSRFIEQRTLKKIVTIR